MLRGLSFLALVACAAPRALAPPPPMLASVELLTLDGKATAIREALGGRPALVSLWATWCEACASEFEPLARLSGRAASLGGFVVAVAVGEPLAKVAEFVKSHQLAYPQLVDEQFHFADSLGQKRVPATLVIDREGRVVHVGGALDETALSALERAITGTPSASR